MTDIKQDENSDIDLSNGDISYVESTFYHQKDILITFQGELKETPLLGCGIADFLQDAKPQELLRTARLAFERDKMKVKNLTANGGELTIDANYENN